MISSATGRHHDYHAAVGVAGRRSDCSAAGGQLIGPSLLKLCPWPIYQGQHVLLPVDCDLAGMQTTLTRQCPRRYAYLFTLSIQDGFELTGCRSCGRWL